MIPKGKVATYGAIAHAAGYPGAARQVAWALCAPGAGALPWHRVVGREGRILLQREEGLHQRTLLEVEGVCFKGDRVDMKGCEFIFSKNRRGEAGRGFQAAKAQRGRRKRARQPCASLRFSKTSDP